MKEEKRILNLKKRMIKMMEEKNIRVEIDEITHKYIPHWISLVDDGKDTLCVEFIRDNIIFSLCSGERFILRQKMY